MTQRGSSAAPTGRSRSPRSTRHPPGPAGGSGEGSAWPPARASRCFRLPRSAAGYSRPRRGGGPAPALFPFAAIGGGLLAAATGGGAVLGAVAGHAAAGMSRHDLKELGEQLDAGQAGLVVVGVADMGATIERSMKNAEKVESKQLKADTAAIEADAQAAQA